jgi:23S rRNA pseudouridine1911/1915/1917 synthase
LGFVHPKTGKELFFVAPLPDDMTNVIEKWRRYVGNRPLVEE